MTDLLADWSDARRRWSAAKAAGRPPSVCNSIMDEIRILAKQIASTPALHGRIDAMCGDDQPPEVRIDAALVREHWDVEGAASTFAAVVAASGSAIPRPVTMAAALAVGGLETTATSAALCLYNIDRGAGNTA